MRLELIELRKGVGEIARKIDGIFSEQPPAWTLKDGKDIGLRQRAYQIRRALIEALDFHGTPVGREILMGVGTEQFVNGIIRGCLDRYPGWRNLSACDDLESVSIERIDPISKPDFFGGEPHRGRIIFPADYNSRPSWIATFEGGRQLPIEPTDLEEELIELRKATEGLYFWKLSEKGAGEFLAGYNKMSFQLPLLFEPE